MRSPEIQLISESNVNITAVGQHQAGCIAADAVNNAAYAFSLTLSRHSRGRLPILRSPREDRLGRGHGLSVVLSITRMCRVRNHAWVCFAIRITDRLLEFHSLFFLPSVLHVALSLCKSAGNWAQLGVHLLRHGSRVGPE
jgi:hypothetical protein